MSSASPRSLEADPRFGDRHHPGVGPVGDSLDIPELAPTSGFNDGAIRAFALGDFNKAGEAVSRRQGR